MTLDHRAMMGEGGSVDDRTVLENNVRIETGWLEVGPATVASAAQVV